MIVVHLLNYCYSAYSRTTNIWRDNAGRTNRGAYQSGAISSKSNWRGGRLIPTDNMCVFIAKNHQMIEFQCYTQLFSQRMPMV